MRILHATSELFPYSKTGGLADMVDGLAKALAGHGHQVGVVTPLYRGIKEQFSGWDRLEPALDLPLGASRFQAQVWTRQPAPNLTLYFIDQPHFYDRPDLYLQNGHDYADNAARFIFFSKCVAHLARHLAPPPELIHLHDWQTGLVPLVVRHQRDHEGWFTAPRTLLTIHNVAFQGLFPAPEYALTNLPPWYFHAEGLEYHGLMSCLKAGLVFADFLTTVSPRYAQEITTPEFGCGLDGVLRNRQNVLAGVLNGVDYAEWKTAGNPHLRYSYAADQLRGKSLQKRALQKELNLPLCSDVPLFGVVSRLSEQKGIDIELKALEETLALPMQFALLGSGAPHFVDGFQRLAERFPEKVALRIGYDQGLSHRIEAGADFFLMPSRFEPCGLNQMYSLRYGTIPIVRATGGLDDSVTDITEDLAAADGIKFHEYSAAALAKAIHKGVVLYQHPPLLQHYRRNAMRADFSWERTCLEYVALYERMRAG
jgi:starch synthase